MPFGAAAIVYFAWYLRQLQRFQQIAFAVNKTWNWITGFGKESNVYVFSWLFAELFKHSLSWLFIWISNLSRCFATRFGFFPFHCCRREREESTKWLLDENVWLNADYVPNAISRMKPYGMNDIRFCHFLSERKPEIKILGKSFQLSISNFELRSWTLLFRIFSIIFIHSLFVHIALSLQFDCVALLWRLSFIDPSHAVLSLVPLPLGKFPSSSPSSFSTIRRLLFRFHQQSSEEKSRCCSSWMPRLCCALLFRWTNETKWKMLNVERARDMDFS